MVEEIINDNRIKEIYSKINENENKNNGWAHHNMEHALRVCSIAENLLKELNYPEDVIEATRVACVLHDIGCVEGKENHAYRGSVMAEKYFEEINFQSKYKDKIIEAIRDHSNGFESDNIITLALLAGDKLDIDKRRMAPGGYSVEGMRQLQYVNEIKIEIIDKTLKINFITTNEFNAKEWENYYFMPKVIKAVRSFANRNNLNYEFYKNGEKWIEK